MSTKASADRSNTTSTTTTISEDNRVAASDNAFAMGARAIYNNEVSPEVKEIALGVIDFAKGAAGSSIAAINQSALNAMEYSRNTEKQALDLVANVSAQNPVNATIIEKITPALTVVSIVLGLAYMFRKRG